MKQNWYSLTDTDSLDSPALLVYPQRVKQNIQTALQMVGGNAQRLQPHIKTCKSAEAIGLMMDAGIYKFKAATIAEAELLATCGAKEVLLAYQASGPKLQRLLQLATMYPQTAFAFLTDNLHTAAEQSRICASHQTTGTVYIDLNVGMNRTGIAPGADALSLYRYCQENPHLQIKGLHLYDGHIRNTDFLQKKQLVDAAFAPVQDMLDELAAQPEIICGGSPSFSVHAKREGVVCSPGTFIYWDHGYASICPEQHFLPAIVIMSRVLSKPAPGLITLDAGHKAMAAENEIGRRIHFLNASGLVPTAQSEEHLVMKQEDDTVYTVGDVIYGLPYHVCPTVNLYERLQVVEDGQVTGCWKTVARDRELGV